MQGIGVKAGDQNVKNTLNNKDVGKKKEGCC